MSFLSRLLHHSESEIVILIDINSDSVGGAYARLEKNTPPTILYTVRLPLKASRRSVSSSMDQVLAQVTKDLVERGAPLVRTRETRNLPIRILVSVGTPWQQTVVHTELIEEKDGREFVFTEKAMREASARSLALPSGQILTEKVIASIMLNGYETPAPFGKRARRASLVVVSSHIESQVEKNIRLRIREAFHTDYTRLLSSVSVSYAVLRDVFPHEQDFLMLAITGETTDLSLSKQGILRSVLSVPARFAALHEASRERGIDTVSPLDAPVADTAVDSGATPVSLRRAKDNWVASITNALTTLHTEYPLPHSVFVIADVGRRDALGGLLDSPQLHSLWLSDNPLSIIPLRPSNLVPFVRVAETARADLFLGMCALYAHKRGSDFSQA